MVDFISLGSGSAGNCYVLRKDGFILLIDMGLGIRAFRRYFSDYGLSVSQIGGVLLTHGHADHVKGIGKLAALVPVPVYSCQSTHASVWYNPLYQPKIPRQQVRVVTHHEPFAVGPFVVTAFPVPHDSQGNNGFFIRAEGFDFCLVTDAGRLTEGMQPYIRRARYVVFEANYDEEMLQRGSYPPYLKQRIANGKGHMSNKIAAEVLAAELNSEVRRLWLCHLSEENNTPTLALQTVRAALEKRFHLRLPAFEEAEGTPLFPFNVAETFPGLVLEALPRTRPTRLYQLPSLSADNMPDT